MAKEGIRLGSTLVFDKEKEKDIIDLVNTATNQHKLGEILSHLLRIWFETPEKLMEPSNEIIKAIMDMEKYGMTPRRYEFFDEVSKEIEDMKNKVDEIYEMCREMHTLAKFGKRLGLEEKANNMLMAEFMAEKQLTDLCNKLGIDNVNHTFISNKLEDANQKSEDTLEYILTSYDSIINELKSTIFKEIELKVNPLNVEVKSPENISTNNNKSTVSKNVSYEGLVDNNKIETKKTIENDKNTDKDEYIDFGDADMNALDSFIGG